MTPMQRMFVISDLHLGGQVAPQMCGAGNRRRLCEFIAWITGQHGADTQVRLVIAGNLVDFQVEEPASVFTANEAEARYKLARIIADSAGVFDALAAFVRRGGTLTLLLGNHDLELSLPGPRRDLLQRLGPGAVEFLVDNEALAVGPVLVEHGSRYDSWNAVDHDGLRRFRSALSRAEALPSFLAPAGNHLAVQVLNRIKPRCSFIDLFRPVTAAVLPFVAVLDPGMLNRLNEVNHIYRRSRKARFEREVGLESYGLIGTGAPEEDHFSEAVQLARGVDPGEIGAVGSSMDAFSTAWALLTPHGRHDQLRRLRQALRAWHGGAPGGWQLDREPQPACTSAAGRSARSGFEVIVYGHTHVAKSVSLEEGALYINTGTWADVVWLPDSALFADAGADATELMQFAEDLAQNRLDHWRRFVPTFARIDLDGGRLASAGLHRFDSPDQTPRLDGAVPDASA